MVTTFAPNRTTRITLASIGVVAVAAIIIGLLLINRPSNVPQQKTASTSTAIIAYGSMVETDMNNVLNAQSSHCDTIADTGCPAAAARVIAPLQAWLGDLDRVAAPAPFALVELQLRRHVALAIADLNGLVDGYQRQNQTTMDDSLTAAVAERDFIELETTAIYGS